MACNYVTAGFETLSTICDKYVIDNPVLQRDVVNTFFNSTCNKFLHSYGQAFKDRKTYTTYNEKEKKLYEECRKTGFFNDSEFIADSGGFQISVGLLNRERSFLLLDLYYDFIENYGDCIDRGFILDVPPGPNCEIFKDFSDVEKINHESYVKAANLPDEARKKIIYINHFRTPKLWDIFSDILNDGEMFNKFDYFATGGIVANLSSDQTIPFIIYTLPLIPLINKAKKYGRKNLEFHILGGATFRDILFYELFSLHVKKYHDIELNITYDSSGMFKQLMVARIMQIYHNDIIYRMDLRSKYLDMRFFESDLLCKDVFKDNLLSMAKRNGLPEIEVFPIYEDESGTFSLHNRLYCLFYVLDMYNRVQTNMKKVASKIYPLYESGDEEIFCEEVFAETQKMNQGRISKKQKAKATNVLNSLKMLKNCDESECKYLVDKYLSKDEFSFVNNDSNNSDIICF